MSLTSELRQVDASETFRKPPYARLSRVTFPARCFWWSVFGLDPVHARRRLRKGRRGGWGQGPGGCRDRPWIQAVAAGEGAGRRDLGPQSRWRPPPSTSRVPRGWRAREAGPRRTRGPGTLTLNHAGPPTAGDAEDGPRPKSLEGKLPHRCRACQAQPLPPRLGLPRTRGGPPRRVGRPLNALPGTAPSTPSAPRQGARKRNTSSALSERGRGDKVATGLCFPP